MYIILGAGLSGLSVADHLSEIGVPYQVYEAKPHGGGHVHSEVVDGFVWDEGPHVSFTKHELVREYFAANCNSDYLEYKPKPVNYFHGSWIPHPAQANMYAVPEELRNECIEDVVAIREAMPVDFEPGNYAEWIDFAFGNAFADHFAAVYTRKYWTTAPKNLTTEWIGKRVYFPAVEEMLASADGPIGKQTHYISAVRYPKQGGFYSYIKNVEERVNIFYNKVVSYISLEQKYVEFNDGERLPFERLINTLPLPQFIRNSDAPAEIKHEAEKLNCSKLLIVNVIADHPAQVINHWIYVYDEGFYSTRINFTELLSPDNGIPGKTGIQVEVYFSAYRPVTKPVNEIVSRVLEELVSMKLVSSTESIVSYHHKWVEWANVIFDQVRERAQDAILTWLSTQGLVRELDDLEPMTDWNAKCEQELGSLIMAGRFAQWKYYWTDDCVMRASYISKQIKHTPS
jgi:protoporphyrinogen oxidase